MTGSSPPSVVRILSLRLSGLGGAAVEEDVEGAVEVEGWACIPGIPLSHDRYTEKMCAVKPGQENWFSVNDRRKIERKCLIIILVTLF